MMLFQDAGKECSDMNKIGISMTMSTTISIRLSITMPIVILFVIQIAPGLGITI